MPRRSSRYFAVGRRVTRQVLAEPGASKSGGYIDRYRNFKYHETLFELFARQFELTKVDEAREGVVIQVVDTALPPERKSKPRKALIAVLATLAAGIALMLFVFVRGSLQNAKHEPESAVKLAAVRAGIGRVLKP